jgi:asparagine N-glycosylation enzyme membrane subunit Stt3
VAEQSAVDDPGDVVVSALSEAARWNPLGVLLFALSFGAAVVQVATAFKLDRKYRDVTKAKVRR